MSWDLTGHSDWPFERRMEQSNGWADRSIDRSAMPHHFGTHIGGASPAPLN